MRCHTHTDYTCLIPNSIGYPEHKRCLVQVQECWLSGLDGSSEWLRQAPPLIGVELDGVGVKNMFTTHKQRVGYVGQSGSLIAMGNIEVLGQAQHISDEHTPGVTDANTNRLVSYGWRNTRSILDDGVLINSPFEKSVGVRLVNLSTLGTQMNGLGSLPTHLVLRLVFLDDDELPGR